ncbi:MAG TPA: hypothetical protein VKX17_05160 [Planctomycetota bacterium]|nr:hypothetical protein [Planctomycetota bacterium]
MRRLSWVVGLFCMLVWAASAADVNFAGTYALDKDKSTLPQRGGGGGGGAADQTWTVTQDAKTISVEKKVTFNGNDRTMKSAFNLDGSETSADTTRGQMTGKTVTKAKWGDDKKTLETSSVFTGKRGDTDVTNTTTEKWSLSDDGKVLTVTSTRTGGTNNAEAKYVLNKK